jgi:plastocyanin
MGEIGPNVTGTGAAPYIMDGIGFPGGEMALMNLYNSQGISGIKGQFNKTLLAFAANVGDTVRFDLANAGNLVHTFHLHDAELISEFQFPGVPYDDANVPLDPAVTDSVLVTLTQPGVYLFHCHVVTHADAGMIGVLVVLPSSAHSASSSISATGSSSSFKAISTASTSVSSSSTSPVTSMITILPNSAGNVSSKGFSPNTIHVTIGMNNTVLWMNEDSNAHTVTSDSNLFDSGYIGAGQSWVYTFTKPGTFSYHCAYHYWMIGEVVVSPTP